MNDLEIASLWFRIAEAVEHCRTHRKEIGLTARCSGCPANDTEDIAVCHLQALINMAQANLTEGDM